MEKIIFFVLIILYFGASLGQDIDNPMPIDMMGFSKRPTLDFYNEIYPVSVIRPFGWSKDGKFAFVSETFPRGLGGKMFSYNVIDVISDEVMWKYEDLWVDQETGIEKSIQKNQGLLSKQFDKFKIKPGVGVELNSFPVDQNGNIFDAKLIELKNNESQMKKLKDSGVAFFRGNLQLMQVQISLNKTRTKNILTIKDPTAYSYWIAGYFMSPFENRILVAIGKNTMGFEGIEGEFIFSGSSLERGFK